MRNFPKQHFIPLIGLVLIILLMFVARVFKPAEKNYPALPSPKSVPLDIKSVPKNLNTENEGVFPEVWSVNGYDGQTFEFKTNCFGDYKVLNECFLFDVSKVTVVTPGSNQFNLEKDFNVNSYSGEVTRRWVLYGPPGAGLPEEGEYTFIYTRGQDVVLTQKVNYKPEVVNHPKDLIYERQAKDFYVSWTPPSGITSSMYYKVLIFPEKGEVISQVISWDSQSAVLRNVPLKEGQKGTYNVSVFFDGGFAYSEYPHFIW